MRSATAASPRPMLAYAMLSAAGLFIVSRLPLAAILAGMVKVALALVRPALLLFGVAYIWKLWGPEFPGEESPGEVENVERLVERGRQMGF